jgi:hypothetical protein
MRLAGLLGGVLLLSGGLCLGEEPAATLPLPQLAQCGSASHPLLPAKWRAVFLMAPFAKAQLVLADIVVDNAMPAMRARLFGVKHGSTDLLVLGEQTYLLSGEGGDGHRSGCRRLGDTGWRPLPRDWLGARAQCVGATPVAETPVDWWKVPTTAPPLTNWMWLKKSDGTPHRLMFVKPDETLAPLSLHAFNHQVRFESLAESDLAADAALCRATDLSPRRKAREALREAIAGMARAPSRADDEIKRLMPELDADCAGTPLPRWPDHFGVTTFMTSLDVRYTPFPTEVLYNWDLKAQRTRMFFPPAASTSAEDALLIGPNGYDVSHHRAGRLTCDGPQPGVLRPDWPVAGACTCEARITGTTPLTPYGSSQIVNCPMTAPRVLWTWYADDGRPMVFMETAFGAERGRVLTLADYYTWMPGHAAPEAAFAKPAQCRSVERRAQSASSPDEQPCSGCHLGAHAK